MSQANQDITTHRSTTNQESNITERSKLVRSLRELQKESNATLDKEEEKRMASMENLYNQQLHEQIKTVLSTVSNEEPKNEEEEKKFLELLRNKHMNNPALFESKESEKYSLSELLLDFELLRTLNLKEELIKERRTKTTKTSEKISAVISSIESIRARDNLSEEAELNLIRKQRNEKLMQLCKVPSIQNCIQNSGSIKKRNEIFHAKDANNTKDFILKELIEFYKKEKENLKLKKYKTLHRWTRFCSSYGMLERAEGVLHSRIRNIDQEYEHTCIRLKELQNPNHKNQIGGKEEIHPKEIISYIRHIVHKVQTSKKFDLFLQKVKWITYLERDSILKNAFQNNENFKNTVIPRFITSAKAIEEQLETLKNIFDLKKVKLDGSITNQEFLYAVSKRFSAVFNAQVLSQKFLPYPFKSSGSEPLKTDTHEHSYLKTMSFKKEEFISPKLSQLQKKQESILKETVAIDVGIQNEITFLSTFDLQYATNRMKEQADTHFQRAHVKQYVENEMDGTNHNLENLNSSKHTTKLTAIYLLKLAKIREFRRKLLNIFNYFESILKRLILDQFGYFIAVSNNTNENLFARKIFTETDDLNPIQSEAFMNKNFSLQSPFVDNRDDSYENKKDILVKDCNGLYIMYKEALERLEKREAELTLIASHYISNNFGQGDRDIDRLSLLEDLYECESWFQDGKRKVMDSIFEAYEHCTSVDSQTELRNVIINLIYRNPILNLEDTYFADSYTLEIMNIELQYTLFKDVSVFLQNQESEYIKFVFRNFDNNREYSGHPDNIVDDQRLKMTLNLGSNKVGFVDFFESTSQIYKLEIGVEDALFEFCQHFSIKSTSFIHIVRKIILQRLIVEWKMISEEDKFQKAYYMRMTGDRRGLEDFIIFNDADDYIGMLLETYESTKSTAVVAKEADSSLYKSSNNNSSSTFMTEGGFDLHHSNGYLCQVLTNGVELIQLWNNTMIALYETDVLSLLYHKLATIAQVKTKSIMEELSFSIFDYHPSTNSSKQKHNSASTHWEALEDLSIHEFCTFISQMNLSTWESVKDVIFSKLSEFRSIYQYQITQRNLLECCVQMNQIICDDYQLIRKTSNIFDLTSHIREVKCIESFYQTVFDKDVSSVFITMESFKTSIREDLQSDYERLNTSLSKSKLGSVIKKKQRELLYKLAGDYCIHIAEVVHTLSIKYHTIQLVNLMRMSIELFKQSSPYLMGLQNDSHQEESTQAMATSTNSIVSTGTCILSKDGKLVNLFYLPHYFQIIQMEFYSKDSNRPQSSLTSQELYQLQFEIIYLHLIIVTLLIAKLQITIPMHVILLNNNNSNYTLIDEELKRINVEYTHLNHLFENSTVIREYLLHKASILLLKTMVSLEESRILFLEQGNTHAAQWIIQAEENLKFSSHQHVSNSIVFDFPLEQTRVFLSNFSQAERTLVEAKQIELDSSIDNLLAEESIYATTMPDKASKLILQYLTLCYEMNILRNELIQNWKQQQYLNDSSTMTEALHLLDRLVLYRAKNSFGFNASAAISNKTINTKRRIIFSWKEKQVLCMKQEWIKNLILKELHLAKEQVDQLTRETHTNALHVAEEHLNNSSSNNNTFTSDGKLEIFEQFLLTLMKKSAKTKSKTGAVVITIQEQDLEMALDVVGTRLNEWKQEQLSQIAKYSNLQIDKHKQMVFNLERRVEYLEYSRELDRKSFMRRVTSEVADKSYDLVFQVESLFRRNDQLLQRILKIREEVKQQLQIEYEELVRDLTRELTLVQTKFEDYQRSLYKQMESKYMDMQQQVLQSLESSTNHNNSLLTTNLTKVIRDSIANSNLQSILLEHEDAERKLVAFHKMRLMTLQQQYENRVREAENHSTNVVDEFYGAKQQDEERQNLLRQELVKTQQNLTNAELEIDQLKKDLRFQIKNKQKLVNWKVKQSELYDSLEDKISKYEQFSSYNVDKLVLEMEKQKKELQNLSNIEEKLSKKNELEIAKHQNELKRTKQKLEQETKLKLKAFEKLEQLQQNMDKSGGNSSMGTSFIMTQQQLSQDISINWEQKYSNAMAELQIALKENELLRNSLSKSPTSSMPSTPLYSRPSTANFIQEDLSPMKTSTPNSVRVMPTYKRLNSATNVKPKRAFSAVK